MASRKDYYDILGIRRGATEEEIETAFRKLTRTYQFVPHPGNKTAESCFKEIAEAYEILSNREKRARYDRSGIEHSSPGFSWDYVLEEEEEFDFEGFEDVFEKYFGRGEIGASRQPQKGRDLHLSLDITFAEAVWGTVRKIQFFREIVCPHCPGNGTDPSGQRKVCDRCGGAGQIQIGLPPASFMQTCPRCYGWGKISHKICQPCSGKGRITQKNEISLQVPPGVMDRCRIFLKEMGHAGKNGGASGDLIMSILIQKHPYFQRKGDDLHLLVPLNFWEAGLGAEVEVPTLDGPEILAIPPGAQEGDQLRLPGKGIPFFHGGGRGDQVICVKIIVPSKLDDRSREILGELKRLNHQNPRVGLGWPFKN